MQAFGDLVQRLVPADTLELPFAPRADAFQRMRQPLVVVVELQGHLRFRANLALEHRIGVVAGNADETVALEVEIRAAAVEADVAAAGDDPVGFTVLARQPVRIGRRAAIECRLGAFRVHEGRRPATLQYVPAVGEDIRQRALAARQAVEIDVGGREQEVVVITHGPAIAFGLRHHRRALAEGDRMPGADAGAGGRRLSLRPPVGAEIAFDGVVVDRVVAHRAVGAGNHAFAAAGAAALVDPDDAGHRILGNRLGIDRAGPEACRPVAMLAADGEEIERRPRRIAEPDHLVAVFARPETVFLLAGDLTALAAYTALEVDHQGEAAHSTLPSCPAHLCIDLTIPPDATM